MALLGGLTIDVMLKSGIDVLVLISLALVGLVGDGVVGSLPNPPKELGDGATMNECSLPNHL